LIAVGILNLVRWMEFESIPFASQAKMLNQLHHAPDKIKSDFYIRANAVPVQHASYKIIDL
jgi:hypothetical protein